MKKNKITQIVVMIFAAFYLIIGVMDLLWGAAENSKFYRFDNIFIKAIGAIMIVSCIGLFFKKEIARKGILAALVLLVIEMFIGIPMGESFGELVGFAVFSLILYTPGIMYFSVIGKDEYFNKDTSANNKTDT